MFVPVNALTKVVLPWSMWPAVPKIKNGDAGSAVPPARLADCADIPDAADDDVCVLMPPSLSLQCDNWYHNFVTS